MTRIGCRSVTKPGDIVAPISWNDLGELFLKEGSRPDLQPALQWRLDKLTPILESAAYKTIWTERRHIMIEAVYHSGDYHYGSSETVLRQVMARWVYARIIQEGS